MIRITPIFDLFCDCPVVPRAETVSYVNQVDLRERMIVRVNFLETATPAPVPSSHDPHAVCYTIPPPNNAVQAGALCIKTRISCLSTCPEADAMPGGGPAVEDFTLECVSVRVSADASRFFR